MMTDSDRDYYRARFETERERGQQAADPVIAKLHLTLAEMYQARIAEAEQASRPTIRAVA